MTPFIAMCAAMAAGAAVLAVVACVVARDEVRRDR